MSKFVDKAKETVFAVVPGLSDLSRAIHPKVDFLMLLLRNIFTGIAVVLFLIEFFLHGGHDTLKAIAYFFGAAAYIFECLAVTDCFKCKVRHTEMFMVYCFGPLYLLMGLDYILF